MQAWPAAVPAPQARLNAASPSCPCAADLFSLSNALCRDAHIVAYVSTQHAACCEAPAAAAAAAAASASKLHAGQPRQLQPTCLARPLPRPVASGMRQMLPRRTPWPSCSCCLRSSWQASGLSALAAPCKSGSVVWQSSLPGAGVLLTVATCLRCSAAQARLVCRARRSWRSPRRAPSGPLPSPAARSAAAAQAEHVPRRRVVRLAASRTLQAWKSCCVPSFM